MANRQDSAPARRGTYTVLAGIANPITALSLLQAGAAIPRARGGRVVLLRVVSSTQEQVTSILREGFMGDAGQVVDVIVAPEGEGIAVDATLYATADLDATRLDALQRQLAGEVGPPVTLQATVPHARRVGTGAWPYSIKVGDSPSEKP